MDISDTEQQAKTFTILENFDKQTIKDILEKKEKTVGEVVLVEGRPAVIKRRISVRCRNKNVLTPGAKLRTKKGKQPEYVQYNTANTAGIQYNTINRGDNTKNTNKEIKYISSDSFRSSKNNFSGFG